MKQIILMCFVCIALAASAQSDKKAAKASWPASSGAVTLSQTSANAAKSSSPIVYNPLPRPLHYRSYSNVPYSNGRPMGLPRGTYGFGNGQLYLRSTDATTSGGITGSGAVGTGSSAGSMGTGGMALGVNGKSPYAGPAMWGSASGLQQLDSVLRRKPVNKSN